MSQFPESHLDLLTQPGVAVLSTRTPSGAIQSTAVWFLLDDDDTLKVSLSDARKKFRNLVSDPTITLLFLDLANPSRYLEVRGTASIAVDPDRALAKKIGAHYSADIEKFDQPGDVRQVVSIVVDRVNAR